MAYRTGENAKAWRADGVVLVGATENSHHEKRYPPAKMARRTAARLATLYRSYHNIKAAAGWRRQRLRTSALCINSGLTALEIGSITGVNGRW